MDHEKQDEKKVQYKCQHVGCNCDVEAGQWYCSDYCSEQAKAEGADSDQDAGDRHCQCGHAQCHARQATA